MPVRGHRRRRCIVSVIVARRISAEYLEPSLYEARLLARLQPLAVDRPARLPHLDDLVRRDVSKVVGLRRAVVVFALSLPLVGACACFSYRYRRGLPGHLCPVARAAYQYSVICGDRKGMLASTSRMSYEGRSPLRITAFDDHFGRAGNVGFADLDSQLIVSSKFCYAELISEK